jgi:hypothetical protein
MLIFFIDATLRRRRAPLRHFRAAMMLFISPLLFSPPRLRRQMPPLRYCYAFMRAAIRC